jgi:DNA-binding CsgD family transcriptional regulator
MMTAEPGLVAALAGLRGYIRNGGSFEVQRDAKRPLHVQVTPIGGGEKLHQLSDRATLIMMVTDPEIIDRRRVVALAKAYALTPAEARFAVEICKGDGRASAALRLGISPATARAHLSRIFEKTGLHRQAELVRLLMTGAQR